MREIILSTNADSWNNAYSVTLTAEALPQYGNDRYIPIELFTIPLLYESHILMASTEIEDANPRWRMGVRLRQLLEANYLPVPNAQGSEVIVPPNRGIVATFPRITQQYRLQIWIPWWFRQVTVRIWQYQGVDEGRLEELVASQTDVIRVDLTRIETKIDDLLT